eukprot:NODE_2021_length_1156_cov_59.195335_g2004_i0.p1 GENE.NODE_2021_length_1156_cov_59.195335_g2004_i0~~NODE_2021_length_1156_cov_59.195335_g2004_i0.p1  ORF type:complete len:336 (+),score=56.62 NODE_2021_length_1156_cov_59.195335_g2004_i0:108-1115(+)
MAKIGEGDPRWIVNERSDGANVNSWHWTEKDISDTVKASLHNKLEKSVIVDVATLKMETTEIGSYTGEASIMNRKGKLSFYLEITLTVSWEGKLFSGDGEEIASAKGKFSLPELDQDCQGGNDLQVDVTMSDSGNEQLLKMAQSEGRKFVRAKVGEFMKELKDSYKINKGGAAAPPGAASPEKQEPAKPAAAAPAPEEKKAETSVTNVLEWRAPASEVFQALTDERRVAAFTRAPAVFEPKVDGRVSFLAGTVVGKVTGFEKDKLLEFTWRFSDWAEGTQSKVNITFTSEEAGACVMKLVHTGVPGNDVERTKQGWRSNFWDPIKMLFGYGFTMK